ncbi:MAG: O-methyltransferase [Candidatus Eisenbacteria bacterium]|nr:O-methyltransferase [Candidatus Eisenbacteria bacterium]
MTPLTIPGVQEYLAGLFPSPDPILREMEEEAQRRDFPIVGPLVGALLEVLSRAIDARSILELGSGYGYSAFWFSRGVANPGRIVLTDRKSENLEQARRNLERAGFPHAYEFAVGDALDRLARSEETWDIVFCDVDKAAYPEVIAPAAERLRAGGLLIFDNMLRSGKVLPEAGPGDAATEGVRRANRMLASHPGLRTTLVPLRDGVTVSVRL